MPDYKKLTVPLAGLEGCYVAGGAVTSLYTNQPINDLDVYPKGEKERDEAIYWAFENGYWCADSSARAISFVQGDDKIALQIMHFDTFETADKIFSAFDFTCCMGAFDLDAKKFELHDKFLEHCSQRFISFNKETRFPYASAWRVKKYEAKGFTIGKIEYQKIMMACAERPINSWEELREQVGGVYGEAITVPADEPFSKEGMWKALDTLTFSDDRAKFGSAREAVAAISKRPIPYIKVPNNGGVFAKYSDIEGFEQVDDVPKNGVEVSIEEMFPDLTFYKKVTVDGDIFRAPHQTQFIYRVGEVATASGPGLFVYETIEEARGHSLWTGKTEAVLELKATCPDDIVYGHQLTLKRAMVVASHPVKIEQKEAA